MVQAEPKPGVVEKTHGTGRAEAGETLDTGRAEAGSP